MNKIFKSKGKSPQELVKLSKDALMVLQSDESPKSVNKASEEISKHLQSLKVLLYGEGDQDPNPISVTQAANEVYQTGLLLALVNNLQKIEFEARKDAAQIFNNLLRRQTQIRFPTVDYIVENEVILLKLVKGYECNDIAGNCGLMLRECLRHESLTKIILNYDIFYNFFEYCENPTFDVASDAFTTFEDLLTKHKEICSSFLFTNYNKFFSRYEKLMDSQNYVLRRQSLRLLAELLLDRSNMNVLLKYIGDPENLKRIMNLLRNKSRNIQFEAFHLFKVFVANPNKSAPVLNILLKNREKLVEFLEKFQNDRTDDEEFNEEKSVLIKQINSLQIPAPKQEASN